LFLIHLCIEFKISRHARAEVEPARDFCRLLLEQKFLNVVRVEKPTSNIASMNADWKESVLQEFEKQKVRFFILITVLQQLKEAASILSNGAKSLRDIFLREKSLFEELGVIQNKWLVQRQRPSATRTKVTDKPIGKLLVDYSFSSGSLLFILI
jgi:hypothetical protein